MPLDTTGYRDFGFGLGPADVELPQVVEVQVDPARNAGADVICFYSGILKFGARGTSEDQWDRGSLNAPVLTGGRRWTPSLAFGGPGWTVFRGGTATLSLASIYNAGVANYAGWAVDAAQVEAVAYTVPEVAGPPHLQIQALLAVRDADGILYRVSYHVVALGNYYPGRFPPVGGVELPEGPETRA